MTPFFHLVLWLATMAASNSGPMAPHIRDTSLQAKLTQLQQEMPTAEQNAAFATAAANNAREVLRNAESAAGMSRHSHGQRETAKWFAESQQEYKEAVKNQTTQLDNLNKLAQQVEYITEAINSQTADPESEQKIRREMAGLRNFLRHCAKESRHACPHHGNTVKCLKSRPHMLKRRCRLLLSKVLRAPENPVAILQKQKYSSKSGAGLTHASGMPTVRNRCRHLIRQWCPNKIGSQLLRCLLEFKPVIVAEQRRDREDRQEAQNHHPPASGDVENHHGQEDHDPHARCWDVLDHLTNPKKIEERTESRKVRQHFYRRTFCMKQLQSICGGISPQAIMGCTKHIARLPPRCKPFYHETRSEAKIHSQVSPAQAHALQQVHEHCQELITVTCHSSSVDDSNLMECLQETLLTSMPLQRSACAHAVVNWNHQARHTSSGAVVKDGEVVQCKADAKSENLRGHNQVCNDGYSLNQGVTYGAKPSHMGAAMILNCKQERKILCPDIGVVETIALSACLIKKKDILQPLCGKSVLKFRQFVRWQKMASSYNYKTFFPMCKAPSRRFCSGMGTKLDAYNCLNQYFNMLGAPCRKQLLHFRAMIN